MRILICDICGEKGPWALAITGMTMQPLGATLNYTFFNCGPQEEDSKVYDLCPECSEKIKNIIEKKVDDQQGTIQS